MSFQVKSWLQTNQLRVTKGFAESLTGELRDTLDSVRKEGEDFLKSIVPVDKGFLVDSAHGGTNQVIVYWRVSMAPDPQRPNADYGYFQNDGWTDRGGNFHPGHFFMERTEAFAARLLYRMTGDALARAGFANAVGNLIGGAEGLETLETFGTPGASGARLLGAKAAYGRAQAATRAKQDAATARLAKRAGYQREARARAKAEDAAYQQSTGRRLPSRIKH